MSRSGLNVPAGEILRRAVDAWSQTAYAAPARASPFGPARPSAGLPADARLADSKTGAKIIPIGPPALEILSALPRDGLIVFPAESGRRHFQGTEKIWRKARQRAGLVSVRIHDLRQSFASMGLVTGDALPVIGKLLGHADVKTTARYAHLADDPLKAAANRISGSIAGALEGKPPAKVVQIRKPGR